MDEFKAGDRVVRVRTVRGTPESKLSIKIGEQGSVTYVYLSEIQINGVYTIPAEDFELVEEKPFEFGLGTWPRRDGCDMEIFHDFGQGKYPLVGRKAGYTENLNILTFTRSGRQAGDIETPFDLMPPPPEKPWKMEISLPYHFKFAQPSTGHYFCVSVSRITEAQAQAILDVLNSAEGGE